MPYKIYTQIAIFCLLLSFISLGLSKFWHPEFEGVVISSDGSITAGDMIYYNGENVARFFGLLATYYVGCIGSIIFVSSSALMHCRYVCLLLSGLSFVRLIAEFFTYNRITRIELMCYGVVIVLYFILIAMWYYNMKTNERARVN